MRGRAVMVKRCTPENRHEYDEDLERQMGQLWWGAVGLAVLLAVLIAILTVGNVIAR